MRLFEPLFTRFRDIPYGKIRHPPWWSFVDFNDTANNHLHIGWLTRVNDDTLWLQRNGETYTVCSLRVFSLEKYFLFVFTVCRWVTWPKFIGDNMNGDFTAREWFCEIFFTGWRYTTQEIICDPGYIYCGLSIGRNLICNFYVF